MSGDKYIITDQHACYFLTFTVIHWVDIFTRREYKDIIVDSLNHCVEFKGLTIYAWVIMSNHMHLVGEVKAPDMMSDFIRDFKKFTSKKISSAIQLGNESRKEWLLDKFSFEARRTRRAKYFKIWKDASHPEDLTNNDIDVFEKIYYAHNNPVVAGIVDLPEHYIYSSAGDYVGKSGLVNVKILT